MWIKLPDFPGGDKKQNPVTSLAVMVSLRAQRLKKFKFSLWD